MHLGAKVRTPGLGVSLGEQRQQPHLVLVYVFGPAHWLCDCNQKVLRGARWASEGFRAQIFGL
jgi:hypothetical protein